MDPRRQFFEYFSYSQWCRRGLFSRKLYFANGITLTANLPFNIRYSFLRYNDSIIFQNSNYLWLAVFLVQKSQNTFLKNISDFFRGITFNKESTYEQIEHNHFSHMTWSHDFSSFTMNHIWQSKTSNNR